MCRAPELLAAIRDGRLVTGTGSLSIGDLVSGSQAAADALRPAGIRRGDRLLLEGWRGAGLLGRILACWSAGAVPVLGAAGLDPDAWPGDAALWSWRGNGVEKRCDGTADDDPPAVVHASSGSTGRPKLARRSFASLLAEAGRYRDRYRLVARERAYVAAPIDHSFAFGALLGLLSAGATVELASAFHPRRLAEKLLSGEVDVVVLTATMARLAIEAAGTPGAKAARPPRLAIAGAGAVPDSLDHAFEAAFGRGLARNYGASETGATFGEAHSLCEDRLGRPFRGVAIRSPRPGEAPGELILDLGHPILGVEGEAPPEGAAAGLWRTGDVVRIASDGTVILLGRLADRLKINGHSIDGADLARLARSIEGVSDALALALARPGRPEIADLVLACEAETDCREAIATRLADQALGLPLRVIAFEKLPRTVAGKIDRAALIRTIEDQMRAGNCSDHAPQAPSAGSGAALEPAG